MLMHFVSTGIKFPYAYFIGLMSAHRAGPTKLWYLQKPNSEYFDKAIESVDSEMMHIDTSRFKALEGRNGHFNLVSLFDHVVWKVVAEQGGSVMGLDSITLKPFDDLLNGQEMLVGCDAETVSDSYCMHGATAKPESKIAAQVYEDGLKALRGERQIHGLHSSFLKDGQLRFGGVDIIPFLNRVYENMDKVSVADFGVLGGYLHDGSPFYLYGKEDTPLLNSDVRTIPFYATWQKTKFDEITEASIQGTLLGKLVREVNL